MSKKLKDLTGDLLNESAFLRSIAVLKNGASKSRLFGDAVRKLRDQEIALLKTQGNSADDWSSILVAPDFATDSIFSSSFYGACRLGRFDRHAPAGSDALHLPAGIYRSTIINSEIGDGCVIHDAGTISNCVVRDSAILLNNGSLSASGTCAFGNGTEIVVGNETGGREIASYAELTVAIADAIAKSRSDKDFLKSYADFIARYLEQCAAPCGYIGRNAVIRNTATIENSYIGDHVAVVGATMIRNSTILATPEEKTQISHGACVSSSCVQWGCEITSMAIVDTSVLCEHSHVERHGKVTMSIIGPNTGVAEGEVTSCLLGPFVGFHHQSMLIAGIWPEGKGNVAYGANIGSNHTSKSPDQEIWCGEGMFFGLGTNIKFPSDFTKAPYSIIATGIDTLPQKLAFPFSLINKPAAQTSGISPSFNELFPGWVLANNIYSVRRNEGKYRKRNKARRSSFEFGVFRPEIIDMMIEARDVLKNVSRKKEIYTSGDIAGIGKNFMTEESRKRGIEAYELYIEYYALSRMLECIADRQCDLKSGALDEIYEQSTGNLEWEHARRVMAGESYNLRSVRDNLSRLAGILSIIADSTYASKKRDDDRGANIIPDYADVNTLADNDSFIRETRQETGALTDRIQDIIKNL
ncbi:MAG: DUF4954 family protein [Spirochaetes bacterium]|nr:DUF4954 family protein [Spirochaetota bacterium]